MGTRHIGISGRTFKIQKKTGHPKISVVLGISGRTFKIQKNGSSENFGHTWNFRSNVQNSKKRVIRKFRWYLEFPVERSKFKKTGHPKISVVLGISGRTFKIQKNGSSENFGHTPKNHMKNH